MSSNQTAVYTGKNRSNTFRDFITEDGFFLVFEAEGGISKSEGHAILKHIKSSHDHHGKITTMDEFEKWLHKALFTPDMPVDFSLSVGVLNDNIMYIKTVGEGEIHLRRGKDFVRVIHGEKVASGFIKPDDMLVITTSTFRKLVEEEEKLKDPLDKDTPEEVVKVLEEHFDEGDDQGCVAIFCQIGIVSEADSQAMHTPNYHASAVQSTEVEEDNQRVARSAFATTPASSSAGASVRQVEDPAKENIFSKFKFDIPAGPTGKRSKILTMAVLAVILIIFVWSVVFGYQRRQAAEAAKKISTVKVSVEKKTTEAEEIAFLNMDRAVELLNESKAQVKDLRASVGKGYAREIDAIEKKIITMENTIVQKEETEPKEFYDLALETKDAKGDVMFLEGDRIAILDKAKDTVYNFSADKKSLEQSKNTVVGDASIVGMSKGVIYVFVPEKGLYKFIDDAKVERVIEDDSDWGKIVDIAFFGGNVYMLDPSKGDIYKYPAIASGYGEKQSYFIGTAPGLSDANSLKIDSSVYTGMQSTILKFTKGSADEFKVSLPEKNAAITDIYTDEETERVFAWDKKNATMYILNKMGR